MAIKHVLVVEDDEIGRQLLHIFVSRLGLQSTLVRDGASALAALELQFFDLVLLDLQLPDMNGLEVVRWLRGRPGGSGVRVLIVSGSAARENRSECGEVGCDAFLAKPFTFDEFKRELKVLFADLDGANGGTGS